MVKRRPTYREQYYDILKKNAKRTGTGRGMGTGAGKPKGHIQSIRGEARELVHRAQKAIEAGMDEDEIVRFLAAQRIIDGDVYYEALKLYPRLGKWGIPIPPSTLIRPEVFKKPTLRDLAKFRGVQISIIKMLREHKPDFFEKLQVEFMVSRATDGEIALLRALRHDLIRQAADRLAKYDAVRLTLTGRIHIFPNPPPKPVPPEPQPDQPARVRPTKAEKRKSLKLKLRTLKDGDHDIQSGVRVYRLNRSEPSDDDGDASRIFGPMLVRADDDDH